MTSAGSLRRARRAGGTAAALRRHWPEYAMEAAELGLFMMSACLVTALLEHPASPLRAALPDPRLRRSVAGVAMGLTAIAVIESPWGRQSGAHLNPAVTLAFLRLGKIDPADARHYVAAQALGAIAGVGIMALALGAWLSDPAVNFAVTQPGPAGPAVAFAAEAAISFGLMLSVLVTSNRERLSRYTPFVSGALVATYIRFESPLSGMSMNPARSLGSAAIAGQWAFLWIYWSAPLLGMALAAELYLRAQGVRAVRCAKLHHHNARRCIFRCGYAEPAPTSSGGASPRLEMRESSR
jgi:aquaporin Z